MLRIVHSNGPELVRCRMPHDPVQTLPVLDVHRLAASQLAAAGQDCVEGFQLPASALSLPTCRIQALDWHGRSSSPTAGSRLRSARRSPASAPSERNAPAARRVRVTNSAWVGGGSPDRGMIAGLAGEYPSARPSSARIVIVDQGSSLETPNASLHELAMLQETEHQRDALLRSFELEEVRRLGHEIVVESYHFVQVHARQE